MHWWENSFLRVQNGRLFIEGREACSIVEEFGSPLFVYSRRQIQTNLESLHEAFETFLPSALRICYAMKANANKEIPQEILI